MQLELEYKGVPYVSRRLNGIEGEHRAPAFRSLNSRRQVPVLKTGETALYESVAIIAFLDRAHPEVPLFSRAPEEHGHIWRRVFEFENYTRDLFDVGVVRPLLRGHAKDDPQAMHASLPDRLLHVLARADGTYRSPLVGPGAFGQFPRHSRPTARLRGSRDPSALCTGRPARSRSAF